MMVQNSAGMSLNCMKLIEVSCNHMKDLEPPKVFDGTARVIKPLIYLCISCSTQYLQYQPHPLTLVRRVLYRLLDQSGVQVLILQEVESRIESYNQCDFFSFFPPSYHSILSGSEASLGFPAHHHSLDFSWLLCTCTLLVHPLEVF